MQLFDKNGATIPSNKLAFSMSTTCCALPVRQCFDGNLGSLCHTEAQSIDTNPRLIIGYACPAGSISQGLFKVLVHNRASNLDRITAYRMQFFKNDGIEETAAAYTFAQPLVVYTAFASPGMLSSQLLAV